MKLSLKMLPIVAAMAIGGQASADIDLGNVSSGISFSSPSITVGVPFTDVYKFTVGENSLVAISATNSAITVNNITYGLIDDFAAHIDLDGTPFPKTVTPLGNVSFQLLYQEIPNLAAGIQHTLTISGTGRAGSNYGASITVAPAAPVPVPGAAWLLGSAVTALVTIARRRSV